MVTSFSVKCFLLKADTPPGLEIAVLHSNLVVSFKILKYSVSAVLTKACHTVRVAIPGGAWRQRICRISRLSSIEDARDISSISILHLLPVFLRIIHKLPTKLTLFFVACCQIPRNTFCSGERESAREREREREEEEERVLRYDKKIQEYHISVGSCVEGFS